MRTKKDWRWLWQQKVGDGLDQLGSARGRQHKGSEANGKALSREPVTWLPVEDSVHTKGRSSLST